MQNHASVDQSNVKRVLSTYDSPNNPSNNQSNNQVARQPIQQLVQRTANGTVVKQQWSSVDDQSTTTVRRILATTRPDNLSKPSLTVQPAGAQCSSLNQLIEQSNNQSLQQQSKTQSIRTPDGVVTSVLSVTSRSESALTVLSRVRMVDHDGRPLLSVARLLHVHKDGTVFSTSTTNIQSKL